MISEGLDTSLWESLEIAEMLSGGILDPSQHSSDAKETAAATFTGMHFDKMPP